MDGVAAHRGARMIAGEREGNCNVIRCPYHSWAYSPEGKLVADLLKYCDVVS